MHKEMIVEDLIAKLKKCDPKAPIRLECWQDSRPRGAFKVSCPDGIDKIVIADDMAYYEDDIEEVGYIIEEVR